MEIEIILSERGKDLILHNANKYRFRRQRKDGNIKWLCTNKVCSASILTTSDKKSILESSGVHTCAYNSVRKIERQILRENCKREGEENLSIKPLKIIRTELLNNKLTEIVKNDIKTVRKTMYDQRRKQYPTFPKSWDEAVDQLKNLHNDDFFQFQDGTFDYASKFFLQLYTIHCYKNGFYVPLVYFFLPDKSKQTYIEMWRFLLMISLKVSHRSIIIKKLHLDFEIGAHEAVRHIFPDSIIETCRFHLGQSWWRKINRDSQLRTAYNNTDDELGQWLKLFFGLPFIPYLEIEDAFLELLAVCPSPIEHIFSDYVLSNYIEPDALFPPNLWASKPTLNPRTINGAESFHRTYNSQFHNTHPPIHLVISILKETQADTETIISSIIKGQEKSVATKNLERIGLTIQSYNDYKNHKNVIKYLKTICYKYTGKKI